VFVTFSSRKRNRFSALQLGGLQTDISQINMKTPKLLSLAALLTLASATVFAQDQTRPAKPKAEVREITLADCPAPVREAVNRALKNGRPDDIHQITRGGNTFYTAEIDMPDGRDVKLWLRPDGAVTKTETEVRLK